MKTVIVLAMHGVPPKDFPREELAEYIGLHGRLVCGESSSPELAARHDALDKKMREWPRSGKNDPFFGSSKELANHLSQNTGHEVVMGFNQFCSPSLDGAFDEAISNGAARVLVITPTMTRGGDQAETDVPEAIRRARSRHPSVEFAFVWPFSPSRVGKFLSTQLRAYL